MFFKKECFMIVKVTQEHIDKARKLIQEARERDDLKYVSLNCPITLALKETFKVEFAEVNHYKFTVGQFPENLVFEKPVPDSIWMWIQHFDMDHHVEPFEFELS